MKLLLSNVKENHVSFLETNISLFGHQRKLTLVLAASSTAFSMDTPSLG